MTGFELYLKRNSKKFDDYLATFFSNGTHPDMGRYLYAPLAAYSANAGKRHRPLICLLACEAVGGDPKRAWPTAAAVEHFHTAALIHDDIEDSSLTRRGEPCMHVVEGDGLAINAGDLALSLVTGTVVDDPGLDAGTKLKVLRELVDMTTRTIEGQALDIGWARDGRFDLTVDDYLADGEPQDGVLLGRGAACRGEHRRRRHRRADRGAAELRHGRRSRVPDPGRHPEPCGHQGVHQEGLPQRHHRGQAHARGGPRAAELARVRTHPRGACRCARRIPAVLAEAVALMREAGSIEFANTYARDLVVDAKEALKGVLPKSRAADLLGSMADFFVKRSS